MEERIDEQEPVEEKDRNGEALRTGVIWGLLSVIITTLIYIIDVTLLGDWKLGLFISVGAIAFVGYMGRKYRNEERDGYISYKESFLYSYVVFFISYIISAVFLILLYEVIDPDVAKVLADQAIENAEKMMRSFGAPEEDIDEALDQMDSEMIKSFSAMGVIKGSWAYLIISAILGAISAFVIRKSKPDFA